MGHVQNADNPDRAGFDWRGFATAVRHHRAGDPRGLRPIARDIGLTINDLSRAMGGTHVEVHKVIALCFWMRRDILDFYIWPQHVSRAGCFTFTPVERIEKHEQSEKRGAA